MKNGLRVKALFQASASSLRNLFFPSKCGFFPFWEESGGSPPKSKNS